MLWLQLVKAGCLDRCGCLVVNGEKEQSKLLQNAFDLATAGVWFLFITVAIAYGELEQSRLLRNAVLIRRRWCLVSFHSVRLVGCCSDLW